MMHKNPVSYGEYKRVTEENVALRATIKFLQEALTATTEMLRCTRDDAIAAQIKDNRAALRGEG